MSDQKMGRREMAKRALLVLGAAAVAPSALAGCGGEQGGGGGGLSCTDTSALSPAELTTRQSQQYVDSSPHADKRCNNCRFYQAGQPNACGTCQVIRGPIHPQGYCNLWVAQA
jgi:hypothetical protein